MENVILIDSKNVGSFFGPLASPYAYKPQLRKRLDDLVLAAARSTNRYFVLEGETVRAAQSTRKSALLFMNESRVLVEVS